MLPFYSSGVTYPVLNHNQYKRSTKPLNITKSGNTKEPPQAHVGLPLFPATFPLRQLFHSFFFQLASSRTSLHKRFGAPTITRLLRSLPALYRAYSAVACVGLPFSALMRTHLWLLPSSLAPQLCCCLENIWEKKYGDG